MINNATLNNNISIVSTLSYIVIGIVVGVLLVVMPVSVYAAMAIGVGALYLILTRPELGILSIVVLISSMVFEDSLPLIPIGIGSLHISDIILLALLCKVVTNKVYERSYSIIRTGLDMPLILFVLVAIISAYNAIANQGLETSIVIRSLRNITYYLTFFVITNLIRDIRQVKFILKGLYTIAIVVAISMIIQSIIGDKFQLVPGRVEKAGTFEEYETLRILPPGQTLIYCLLITAISYAAISKNKYLITTPALYVIVILGSGVILTYNRTYWVAIFLSIGILMAISIKPERKKLVNMLVIMTTLGSCLSIYSILTGTLHETRLAVSERFNSLFAGNELTESGPIDDRITENMYAIKKIADRPLLGNGLGNDYRPSIYGQGDMLHNYVHNGYLYLILNTGFIGTTFFLWFYCGFLVRGIKHIRRIHDPFLKSAATGNVLSGVGIVIMTFANPIFMQWFSIVVISIIIGLTETIIRINGLEARKVNGQ